DVEMRLTDGKRHDHKVHEQEHQFAVDEAAEDGTFDKYAKLSTGEIVDGRGRERDGEVTHKGNSSGRPPHLTRPLPKIPRPIPCRIRNGVEPRRPNPIKARVISKMPARSPPQKIAAKGFGTVFIQYRQLDRR